MMRRTALVVFFVLAIAAPAQAASAKVTWPESRAYAPGEKVSVTVAAKRAVRVSVVRTNAAGKPIATVAKRTLKRGTLSATLAKAGTYAVRVGERRRALQVVAPTAPVTSAAPAPSVVTPPTEPGACTGVSTSVELRLDATTVAPGGRLPYQLVNLSATDCMNTWAGFSLERLQADGTWAGVQLPYAFPLMAVVVPPLGSYSKAVTVPADFAPGTYRLIDAGGPATFEVVA